jgi:hypothetical protein
VLHHMNISVWLAISGALLACGANRCQGWQGMGAGVDAWGMSVENVPELEVLSLGSVGERPLDRSWFCHAPSLRDHVDTERGAHRCWHSW